MGRPRTACAPATGRPCTRLLKSVRSVQAQARTLLGSLDDDDRARAESTLRELLGSDITPRR